MITNNTPPYLLPIQGYENEYEISDSGIIRSLNRVTISTNGKRRVFKSQIIKPRPSKDGYPRVNLWKNGDRKTFYVHQLVALTFISNSAGKPQVNHVNGIKTDYSLHNLEWVTISENVKHACDIGLNKPGQEKPVINYLSGRIYKNMKQASEAWGKIPPIKEYAKRS